MNKEIKEIIDCLELAVDSESYKILLNYITNLQKENYELNRMCELYGKSLYYAELTDYKSRCEKANNQLKIIMQILKEQPNRSIKDDEWLENRLIAVANILQNGSDNNER